MDTDDLTESAWDIIIRAAHVSDALKAELGAMARRFRSEDEWLQEIRLYLEEIIEDPDGYAEDWDPGIGAGLSPAVIRKRAAELCRRLDEILNRQDHEMT
jgi:hypothetical protein